MSRAILATLLICFSAGVAHVSGMDCSLGTSEGFINKIASSCPLPFQPSRLEYCCYNLEDKSHYCCDAEEFAIKTGLGIVVPIVIGVAVIVAFIICCMSCLCCSCCPWYRHRHRGTVYGKVQTPSVVNIIQTPANPASNYPTQPPQYPPQYPTHSAGMPQPAPPQYTNEAYVKQAPYNPDYVQ